MFHVLLALSLAGAPPPRPRATADEARHHPELALAVVGGTYATAAAYTYLAWYRRSENSDTLRFREEGLFGHDTYAGGADKLGHAWSNYVLTRGISGVLSWGGVSKAASIATSTSLDLGFFALIELKDGYEPKYGFSWGDVLFNVAGSTLGIGAESFPVIDEFIAFRLQYWPSRAFVRRVNSGGAMNVAEDYSGYYRATEQAPAGVRAMRFATQVLAPPFTTLEISRATRR